MIKSHNFIKISTIDLWAKGGREVKYSLESEVTEQLLQYPPKSRFRESSSRVKRSNPIFFNEIAVHLAGARNDRTRKGFPFLNRDLGPINHLIFLEEIYYDVKLDCEISPSFEEPESPLRRV
jgi:hypothetical protein